MLLEQLERQDGKNELKRSSVAILGMFGQRGQQESYIASLPQLLGVITSRQAAHQFGRYRGQWCVHWSSLQPTDRNHRPHYREGEGIAGTPSIHGAWRGADLSEYLIELISKINNRLSDEHR